MVSQDYQNIQVKDQSGDKSADIATEYDLPVLPALNTKMNVNLIVGQDHQLVIVHDEYLPYVLKWIEYDEQNKVASFVSETGAVQPLGFTVQDDIVPYIETHDDVAVIMRKDGTVGSFRIVPLIKNNNYIN